MFLSQISIGKRLTLVLGLILALFFASSVVAVVKLSQLGKEIDAMVNDNIKTERAGSDWLRHTTSGVQRAAAIAKSSDASLIPYFAPATAASIRDTNELQKFIESKMDTPEKKQHFAKVGDLRKDYLAAREEVSKFKQAGDAENANKVFTERFEPTSRSYLAGVQQMVDGQRAELDAAGKQVPVNAQNQSALRRFFVGPNGCEVTGISFSPDQKTLFVGIQHPGENGGSTFPEHLPNGKPRSSVMAIRREDGGIVGA